MLALTVWMAASFSLAYSIGSCLHLQVRVSSTSKSRPHEAIAQSTPATDHLIWKNVLRLSVKSKYLELVRWCYQLASRLEMVFPAKCCVYIYGVVGLSVGSIYHGCR